MGFGKGISYARFFHFSGSGGMEHAAIEKMIPMFHVNWFQRIFQVLLKGGR